MLILMEYVCVVLILFECYCLLIKFCLFKIIRIIKIIRIYRKIYNICLIYVEYMLNNYVIWNIISYKKKWVCLELLYV